MGIIKKLNKWANRHTYWSLDILRMALGLFLVVKGFQFIGNSQKLYQMVESADSIAGSIIAIHYIAPAHLVGGLLIFVGLLTRWATIAQLPILIGAILVNLSIDNEGTELLLSVVTLILCLFFTFYGSGKRSADYSFGMQQ
jgi:uncharacterized membrane protein YphA (DoxX/SURF4 family)